VNDLYVCGLRTRRVDGCAGTGVYLLRSDSIVPWRQQTTGCSRSVGQITLEESDKLTRGSDSDDRRS
jgi:hypothetical protein